MFYRVLFVPDGATGRDPRHISHPSLAALIAWVTDSGDPGPKLTEPAAVETVRERWPEAIGMPMPLRIGSGETIALGVLDSIQSPRPADTDDAGSFQIPFVALVLAIPETTADKKPGRQFQKQLWRLPPRTPLFMFAAYAGVELRWAGGDDPLLIDVEEGAGPDGRRTIYGRAPGGLDLSFTFPPPVKIDDLRFQVFQPEGEADWFARSDAYPTTVLYGGSDILALSSAVDAARRILPLATARGSRRAGARAEVSAWPGLPRRGERDAGTLGRRAKQEPWAIGRRIANGRGATAGILHVEGASGEVVMTEQDLSQDAGHHEAREYIPWHEPPDWPGVVAVVHPAAWSSVGIAMVDGLVRRFDKDVHVVALETKWILVFVDEPVDSEGLHHQWWAVAHPDGRWEILATS